MKGELSAFLDQVRPAIDAALDGLLPVESAPPARIHQAMRYSVFAGGKRLRPALCLAGYSLYRQDLQAVLPVACAIEMAHTYSLIHDDLPAMDDDDFRRGVPSCHKKFGEAVAILAGDALLTLSFGVIAAAAAFPPDRIAGASARFAQALGTREGMIAGQVLDLDAEGRTVDEPGVEAIHRAKTAALISASVGIGAYLAGASGPDLEQIGVYGQNIGLAFQIVDDILDLEGGKDGERKKATYPAVYGLDRSVELARRFTSDGREAARKLGDRAALLIEIADSLETRCA
ncbi:MAG TPA: farnesyl diphosphate synthase [Terriglobia bacterium]|nr:farnesyl diphosphate synthase [Terriglobia bacterium]